MSPSLDSLQNTSDDVFCICNKFDVQALKGKKEAD